MKHFLILSCLLVLVSCTGIKELPTKVVDYPSWISSRPISSEYYIGIAKSSKSNADYQTIAKQNALLDLSSEISVKLSSESIFHQVDKGDTYREDYQSLILVESQKNLEGYTMVASWESDDEYCMYYQLSKTQWQKIRADRRQKAITIAYSHYKTAEAYSFENNFISTVHYAVKALDALHLHLNESLLHPALEQPLDILCFQLLKDVYHSVNYKMVNGAEHREMILMGTNISLEPFDVNVGIKNAPFKVRSSFRGIPNRLFSDESGLVKARAKGLDLYKENHFVQFILDWDSILQDVNASSGLKSLLEFPEKSFRISFNVLWPKIAINSTESNLGETMSQSILSNETINYLKGNGFEIVDSNNADFIISISSNTNKGVANRTMHTSMLEYEFVVKTSTGKVIYQKQDRALKGVQSSFESAGINAYERCLDDFKWDVLKGFMSYLEGN